MRTPFLPEALAAVRVSFAFKTPVNLDCFCITVCSGSDLTVTLLTKKGLVNQKIKISIRSVSNVCKVCSESHMSNSCNVIYVRNMSMRIT